MPLTPRDSFKAGFLERCARDGLTPEQMLAAVGTAAAALEKTAVLGALLGKGLDLGAHAGKTMLGYGLPAALIAPPVLGGLAGYGLAKATDVDDTDVDEIKNRELVEEYRRQADRMKRQKAVRAYKQERAGPGRLLM